MRVVPRRTAKLTVIIPDNVVSAYEVSSISRYWGTRTQWIGFELFHHAYLLYEK